MGTGRSAELTGTSVRIWELIVAHERTAEVLRVLGREYAVEAPVLRKEVARLVAEPQQGGFLDP